MPTKKPRVTFAISEEQLATVETYQQENRIKNQSQAILSLIDKGLSDFLPQDKEKAPPPDAVETKLINMYRKLNEEGQEKLVDYADDLVSSGKYKKGRAPQVDTKEA